MDLHLLSCQGPENIRSGPRFQGQLSLGNTGINTVKQTFFQGRVSQSLKYASCIMHIQEGIIPYFLHSKMHIFFHILTFLKSKCILHCSQPEKRLCKNICIKICIVSVSGLEENPRDNSGACFKKCCITQTPGDIEEDTLGENTHIDDSWSQMIHKSQTQHEGDLRNLIGLNFLL